MNETFEYLKTFARFPFDLREFLRAPLTLERAQQIVRERMAQREQNFLDALERTIYPYPHSPYRALLEWAGCELGDARALVKQNGLEGALRVLREGGVYVTFEEFKGRKPIERNGLTISVKARDFDNPIVRGQWTMQTGGSTGIGTAVNQDLAHVGAVAAYPLLALAAHGVFGAPLALCSPMLPAGGLRTLLLMTHIGHMPQKWFSPIGWRDSRYWLKYALATRYMLAWTRAFGARVPFPTIARREQAELVAHWIVAARQHHPRVVVSGNVSYILRVCVAAQERGLDLTGTLAHVGGEPLTPAKARLMQQVGVTVMPGYGAVETGSMGLGCAQPSAVDDVHWVADSFALITHPHRVEPFGVTVPAFTITALRVSAPKVLLNVQLDDYGIVEERACGCALDAYGYHTHLREIRSYSKLVGEGVTLIGNEMLRILDQVLPARFGGTPQDYQLMEQEDARGLTRVALVISPRVQIADEQQVIEVVLNALRASSPMADAARTIWQNAHALEIQRAEPTWTGRGKLLPLHIQRNVQDETTP